MTQELATRDFSLDPPDAERLSSLCGPFDEHLRQVELRLGVELANRGSVFRVIGTAQSAALAERVLRAMWARTEDEALDAHAVNLMLQESGVEQLGARDAEGAQTWQDLVKKALKPLR
jgi:phosphate starvation-inducible PhoH-like protein